MRNRREHLVDQAMPDRVARARVVFEDTTAQRRHTRVHPIARGGRDDPREASRRELGTTVADRFADRDEPGSSTRS